MASTPVAEQPNVAETTVASEAVVEPQVSADPVIADEMIAESSSSVVSETEQEAVTESPLASEPVIDAEAVELIQSPAEATITTPEQNDTSVELQANAVPAPPYFAEPQFEAPAKKPKKTLIAILVAVVAIVLAGAVVVASCFSALEGLFIKSFGSAADYFKYVETKSWNETTDNISEQYASVLTNSSLIGASKTTLKMNISDNAISLLEDAIGISEGNIDLNWLNTISIDMNVNTKDGLEQVLAALKLNEKTLIDMDFILDMDKGDIFVAFLTLSDKYLKGTFTVNNEITELYTDTELRKALPPKDEFDKLLDKYIQIVIDNLDKVEKSSDVLSIGDIEQKLTVLEVKIEAEDVATIASALLKAAKEDEQLKKYIEDVAKQLEKKELIDDADEIYDDFCDGIESALDDLEDSVKDIEEDDSYITWIDYVNSNHEIVGRKFEFDSDEVFYYATVREDDKFACEYEVADLVLVCEGTDKNDSINAEYTIKYDSEKICEISVDDYKSKDNLLNGKVRIEPSSKLLENMGLDSSTASMLSIASPALELNFESKKDSAKVDFNLMSGDEMFLGITLSAAQGDSSAVALPDSEKVYEQDEISQWAESMDFEILLDKLEEAGVPSDLVNALESILFPSYDYDTDYDYAGGDVYAY